MKKTIEVSIAELIDKITILRIKEERIKSPEKLKEIKKELKYLEKKCTEIDEIKFLVEELKYYNEKLWDLEEVIRNHEKQQNFDEEFIFNARHDAIYNDKRYLVKRQINEYFDSKYKEQKSYEGM